MYGDGGISGATTERPTLKRRLADIEARKVDTVVVHPLARMVRVLAADRIIGRDRRAMRGVLEFQERYGSETGCIEALVRRERGSYRNRNRK
jgi:DNA invertase Pin-like site-specific DNA recombinase